MATFNKDKLTLAFQSVAGPRSWAYTDTGLLIADVNEVAGFFTIGYQCGMRKGDRIFITEGDTGPWLGDNNENASKGGRRQYAGTVMHVVDTGATQVTVGRCVLIGDTG